jgi:hypothetical protein
LKIAETVSYPVSIFIAGDSSKAADVCREYCDFVGLCVTITDTKYIYTGGEEEGVIVGLINYPRFPSNARTITTQASLLAHKLLDNLGQESCTIQTPDKTIWLSNRPQDN